MSAKGKVLVTNGARRKAGPIIRSLGQAGVAVHVMDDLAMPACRLSRYSSRFLRCPHPAAKEFPAWLLSLLQKERYDAIFPLDEDVIDAILVHREEVERFTRLPLPATESYSIARNKSLTAEAAKAAGVLTPATWRPQSVAEAGELARSLPYPVIVKPRFSSGSRGIARAATPEMLRKEWERIHAMYPAPLIQQLIPDGGETYGVSVLFNGRHEPRALLSHRRIREYPRSGGPSTLREAVKLPQLETQTIRLLQSLRWFGVAMVEYKTDPLSQTPYLLEINPRFWGSIALAIHAGVDFPALLYRMLMEGDIDAVFDYKDGARCRWLIGDLLHFLSIRPRMQGAVQLLRSFDRKTACDEINADDPWMGLGYILSGACQFLGEPKFRALLRGQR